MIKIKLILSLLGILMSFSCSAQTIELEGKWSHDYRKDSEKLEVYVKGENPELPPARFRQVFIFQKDNECKFTSLSSDDRNGLLNGTYKLTKDKLVIKNAKGKELHKFSIKEVSSEMMIVEKL